MSRVCSIDCDGCHNEAAKTTTGSSNGAPTTNHDTHETHDDDDLQDDFEESSDLEFTRIGPNGSILRECLADMAQVRPARRVEECTVGPTDAERKSGRPAWATRIKRMPAPPDAATPGDNLAPPPWRRRKRKAPADDDDNDGGGGDKDTDAAPPDVDDGSEAARLRTFPSPSFRHAVRTFLSSGCAIIPSVLPQVAVEYCYKVAQSDLKFLTNTVGEVKRHAIATSDANLLAASVNMDFREILDRDGGRRDVRFYFGSDSHYNCDGIIYNPIVYPLVKELLGGGVVNLLYAGIMWGTRDQAPGDHQKWHGDGGHLFDHLHLPPHCINVFYPLIGLPDRNIGPTEVQAGSHILGKFNSPGGGTFALTCRQGDAVLFDYRIKHRGLANIMPFTDRPVLYLAYAKPYFRDVGNTRSTKSVFTAAAVADPGQYAGFDSPPWTSRILSERWLRMGGGFERENLHDESGPDREDRIRRRVDDREARMMEARGSGIGNDPPVSNASHLNGSGERSVLFRMNVELTESGDGDEPTIITFHEGDVPSEVAAAFCREHSLQADFLELLANSIQQQVDSFMTV